MSLRAGELFAGYGGLAVAVSRVLDADTCWLVENDPGASKVLASRFPGVPNYGDITQVDWAAVEPVDVLAGGFPCQSVSTAGARKGLVEGAPSGLWRYFAEAINALRPSLVVIENVRGLLSAQADSDSDLESCAWCLGALGGIAMRAHGAVCSDLADLGYDAQWAGVRAADVGAPHGRFRVFIIAWPQGQPPTELAASPESLQEVSKLGDPLLPTPRASDGVKGGPNQHGSSGDLMLPSAVQTLLPTPRSNDGNKAHGSDGYGLNLPAATALLPTPQAHDAVQGKTPEQVAAMRARGHGVSNLNETIDFGPYTPAIKRWEAITGRPAPEPTQLSKRGTPQLSPLFVEWLMGLAAPWVTDPNLGLSRNAQLRILGNGVVPQQAEHALRHLLAQAEATI